ncbi:MAG: U32 family peptidase [Clostridia bacterium]|nr:U32 family peptidase [Clostridia bacterium]
MSKKKRVELLAPAGSMECFDAALRYGADAIYLAGKKFGLRAFAANFTEQELRDAICRAHDLGKKVYITVNSLFHNDDLDGLPEYLAYLKEIGADAVIVSDPGIIDLCIEAGLNVHISTQMSTMNYRSAAFWHKMGAERIVLARETSLAEIRQMHEKIPDTLEIEAFIHGAMCVAYSGRCLLSSVLTGRSGNKGACAQPCRWRFALHEAQYPEEYFPIIEEDHETFVLNSKDMMMIEHVPALIEAGIASFKIEGRMKSQYYVAAVVNAYRRAIDAYYADPEGYQLDPQLLTDLRDCATRGFTTGFYFDGGAESMDIYRKPQQRDYSFCGVVVEEADENGLVTVEQRNKFCVGERLSILSPHSHGLTFTLEELYDAEGQVREAAPHPQEIVRLRCPEKLHKGDMLRLILK